jgi:hypothetical protein
MKLKLYGVAAAVLFAFSSAALAQSGMDRKVKDAEEDRIEADYKADKARCGSMNGNAKDICEKEAKGKEKVAKAELDAKKNPSERNQRNVEQAKAEAKYEVAKERCDDMQGKEKNVCQKEAKAEHERAKAAMTKRNASAGSSSPAARSSAGTAK